MELDLERRGGFGWAGLWNIGSVGPFLEKHDHTYTHLFYSLVYGCEDFEEKIIQDHHDIHSPPNSGSESTL